jgi:formylglycine-generating enzyme required for sulfatase activity
MLYFVFVVPLAILAQVSQTVKINPKDGLVYVRISSGTSLMGCSPGDTECFAWEKTARPVTLGKGFWIGKTEVTQEAYQRVTGKNPSRYIGARLPVDQISWHDARSYCEAVQMRLPTKAEWEYAARGGDSSARYGTLESIAWYDGNSDDTTHEVGQKQPNGYGLHDTLGNVWEWVEDWYQGAGKNMKVLAGGSFFNPSKEVRVSNFLWASPNTAHRDMGVRCAGD